MSMIDQGPKRKLVVFSDDWGRHPSSCQHLVRQMLHGCDVLWVNTIGTRLPGLNRQDLAKAVCKIRQWLGPKEAQAYGRELPANLHVLTPKMYPGFRRSWQRSLNARLISRQVNRAMRNLGWSPDEATVLTTLPVTADLPGRLNAKRWVYYCVDDFSLWPGLDAQPMRQMESDLVQRVDAAVAVSQHLQKHLENLGRPCGLLTHGIDLDFWSQAARPASSAQTDLRKDSSSLVDWCRGLQRPILLFWGLVDRRLDDAWCERLAAIKPGTLLLIGPTQNPSPTVVRLMQSVQGGGSGSGGRLGGGGVGGVGGVEYELLPTLAQMADVLVMPYADLPVTRAMQPLKFKEYLATGKPVVARNLPAIREWADVADLVDTAEQAVQAIEKHLAQGAENRARMEAEIAGGNSGGSGGSGGRGGRGDRGGRLVNESWSQKAKELERLLWI